VGSLKVGFPNTYQCNQHSYIGVLQTFRTAGYWPRWGFEVTKSEATSQAFTITWI